MDDIRIWLNSKRIYEAGAKLYDKYGQDPLLKKLFSEKTVSPFKTKKLIEALTALAGGSSPDPVKKLPKEITTVEIKNFEKVQNRFSGSGWSKDMDEVESALREKWLPLFSELNALCSKVYDLAIEGQSDPYKKIAAAEMTFRICDLEEACDEVYEEREYYLKHGKIPEKFPFGEPCLDPMLIPQKLANAERYVREYKKKLEKKPEHKNYLEQLDKHQWFVSYYKKILKKE